MLEKQVARLGRDHGGQPDGWGATAKVPDLSYLFCLVVW